jgi:Isochorismatase family
MPTALAGVYQLRQAKTRQRKQRGSETGPLVPDGPPGFVLAPELQPRPSEAVIDKITMSAFEGTPLDIVLRDCGVRAYLIVGVALVVGIEPTAPAFRRPRLCAGNRPWRLWGRRSSSSSADPGRPRIRRRRDARRHGGGLRNAHSSPGQPGGVTAGPRRRLLR